MIGIESDHGAVAHARQKLSAAGLYGSRITILEGTLQDGLLPQYFADLIVSAAQLDSSAATVDAELLVRCSVRKVVLFVLVRPGISKPVAAARFQTLVSGRTRTQTLPIRSVQMMP